MAAIGGIAYYLTSDKTTPVTTGTPETPTTMPVDPTPTPVATSSPSANMYKDGTYNADGTYPSPGGLEGETITITLKNDIVTNATFVSGAKDPESRKFQGKFAAGFKTLVVGKNIDDVKLTVVNGSSLTSIGFTQALAKIKLQAKLVAAL